MPIRFLSLISVLLIAILAVHPAGAAKKQRSNQTGDFDFFVLSLSWSPSYCAAEGERANRLQCHSGRPFAFVVHGLWPQYERGWPSFCRPAYRGRLRKDKVYAMLDLMPSPALVRHQWKKHGSCSGQSANGYFDLVRKARQKITVPTIYRDLDDYLMVSPGGVEAAFRAVNPGLPPEAIAVTCDRRRLREVRICLTRDLRRFRACEEIDRKDCRQKRVVMPPVRDGG